MRRLLETVIGTEINLTRSCRDTLCCDVAFDTWLSAIMFGMQQVGKIALEIESGLLT